MIIYILKRIGMAIITIFVIATLVFFLSRAIPGGPFDREKPLPQITIDNLNRQFNLDKPLYIQYLMFMQKVATFDFGASYYLLNETVNQCIERTFPISASLGIYPFCLAILLGIPLGVVSALYENRAPDMATKVLTTLLISVPNFVVAVMLAYFIGVKLRLLPVAMWGTWRHMVMPIMALTAGPMATIIKYMRASMREVLDSDYVRTAKAKGGSSFTVTYVHALRNALLPILTVAGPMLIGIMCGNLVVERIFAIPGLGSRFTSAITGRDYSMIMGLTIFYAILFIGILLVVDILYSFVDPRIKVSSGSRGVEGGD